MAADNRLLLVLANILILALNLGSGIHFLTNVSQRKCLTDGGRFLFLDLALDLSISPYWCLKFKTHQHRWRLGAKRLPIKTLIC